MRSRLLVPFWLLWLTTTAFTAAAERPDILVNDFESESYGPWQATGDAFGVGPARGTLLRQRPVSGFEGERLVNSYNGGDVSTGTLLSPPIRLQRKYLHFLIGGGHQPEQCELQLLIDDNVVARATGHDDEGLLWSSFDLTEHQNREARVRIIDSATGGWGHINVDQIVLSDRRVVVPANSRTIELTDRYLHLPVSAQGTPVRMRISVDNQVVRQFDIVLSETPDFWVFSDVSRWQGATATLTLAAGGNSGLHLIRSSDELPGADQLYREMHRPQFHFTSRRGWLNDPNGLVYHNGQWHLFYQHNPYGWPWGNMHWGHAVSSDLFHWTERGTRFHPFGEDTRGGAFSGSAVVDRYNTGGWKTGDEDVIVAALTDTQAGEVIAYSNDGGRTFEMFSGNPVVQHVGRDPRLLWHEPTQRWVMAVYQEADEQQWIAFYSSPDLKSWTLESRIAGFYECPDLFELPVDGDPANTKWILHAADAQYVIGDFDGQRFTPDHEGKHQVWYGNYYAAQSYSHAPDGRRVQIGWGRDITFPGMPFNQQMAVPVELTLRSTAAGPRLFVEPVRELAAIRQQSHSFGELALAPGDADPLAQLDVELVELDATFRPATEGRVVFNLRGAVVTYFADEQMLECAGLSVPLTPVDGQVRLQLLVDRGSIECFGNSGQIAISRGIRPASDSRHVHVRAEGAPVSFKQLTVHELGSTWK